MMRNSNAAHIRLGSRHWLLSRFVVSVVMAISVFTSLLVGAPAVFAVNDRGPPL